MADWYVDNALGLDNASKGTAPGAGAWKTIHYALRYGNVSHGDNVHVASGVYNTFYSGTTFTTAVLGDKASGPINVIADGLCIVDIPANAITQFFYPGADDYILFNGFAFNNPSALGIFFFRHLNAGGRVEFVDCDINGNAACAVLFRGHGTANSGEFNLNNTRAHNAVVGFSSYQGTRFSLTMTNGSAIYNCQSNVYLVTPADIVIDDSVCTGAEANNIYMGAASVGSTYIIRRSILTAKYAADHLSVIGAVFGVSEAEGDLAANPGNWVFEDNKVWTFGTVFTPDSTDDSDDDNNFGRVIQYNSSGIVCDESNVYAHPGFELADIASGDFLDTINYTHPTLPAVTLGSAAFFGDSIMEGTGATEQNPPIADATAAWAMFGKATGVSMVDPNLSAIAGMGVFTARWHIDRVLQATVPEFIFVSIGLNNILNGILSPSNATVATIANVIIVILKKITAAGSTPIWLGMSSLKDPTDNTVLNALCDLVDTACVDNDWIFWRSLTAMQQNASWETEYYTSLATDLHPNDAGHAVIGEVAEILYTQAQTGVRYGLRKLFDGSMPDLELAAAAPGKLQKVQVA